jgi:hypothetical protein
MSDPRRSRLPHPDPEPARRAGVPPRDRLAPSRDRPGDRDKAGGVGAPAAPRRPDRRERPRRRARWPPRAGRTRAAERGRRRARHDQPTLTGFLEHAAGLHAQELDARNDRRITVSTIHRARGSEALAVALLGCEEQLLPSWRSISSPDPDRLTEERRLFYLASTRAKDRLLITHVAERGRRATGGPSRFLAEAGLVQTASRLAAETQAHNWKGRAVTIYAEGTMTPTQRTETETRLPSQAAGEAARRERDRQLSMSERLERVHRLCAQMARLRPVPQRHSS